MNRTLRKQARELLHMAGKVYRYRKDLMAAEDIEELDAIAGELAAAVRKGEGEVVRGRMDRLDKLLRKVGGKIYPKTFWNDNTEVLVVAAIVVIGIRSFFFQPFIIPTNSMYPTYSGMNAVVYDQGDSPSVPRKLFNFVTRGARHYRLEAEAAGEVAVPVVRDANGQVRVFFEQVRGRKWFGLLPAVFNQYSFAVGGELHQIRVPAEFRLDDVIGRTLLNGNGTQEIQLIGGRPFVRTGKLVAAGDPILEFDITLGDALFVDRFSYHFRRPKAGEPFVFRTREIPGIEGSAAVDKYYIKRIGGAPGERLEIRDGALYADGAPRDEAAAFERNAAREGEYDGYDYPQTRGGSRPQLLTGPGDVIDIPAGSYVALGDNSDDSLDSRYWGYVPEQAIVGKAFFIYYPFTKRWGPAE